MIEIEPEWRTPAVVALCRQMLIIKKYDALPLLADALREAGCTNTHLLLVLERQYSSFPEALVGRIYSSKIALTIEWLEEYLEGQCPGAGLELAAELTAEFLGHVKVVRELGEQDGRPITDRKAD